METTPSLIFITGGVRSGKSRFAEKIACELGKNASPRSLHYIATGVPSDSEMDKRIQAHQQQRLESGNVWKTWEQPRHIDRLAGHFSHQDILLLDCLTTLLNNELFSSCSEQRNSMKSIIEAIGCLKKCCQTLIVVSSEVFNEPIQDNALVFTYKRMLGHLHQQLVDSAAQAYKVESGIPIIMKGGQCHDLD